MSQVNLLDTLTEREAEVYALLVLGYSQRQIADELVIAFGTVKYHLANIYNKLEVDSRAKAVAYREQLKMVGLVGASKTVSFSSGQAWGEAEIREAANSLIANGLGERKTVNQVVTDLLLVLEGRL